MLRANNNKRNHFPSFTCVWILVYNIKGRTQLRGAQRQKYSGRHPNLKGKSKKGWTNFQNEQSCDFYATSNIIRMTKPYTVRLADHEEGTTAQTATYTVLPRKYEGKRRLRWHDISREAHVYCCPTCFIAGLLARSQHPEGPATGHLGTGFSSFPCV